MTKPPFQPVIKEGWLLKEGGFVHSWKKRWFVLGKGPIKYFVSKYKGEKGSFQITPETVVTSARGPKNEPALNIKTPGRTYYLVSEKETEAVAWINTLNKVIEALKNGTTDQLESEIVNQFTNQVFDKSMIVPQYNEGDLKGYFDPLPHLPITQKQIFQLPSKLNTAYRIYLDLDYNVTKIIKSTSNFIRSVIASQNGTAESGKIVNYDDFFALTRTINEMFTNLHQCDYSEVSNPEVKELLEEFNIVQFTENMKNSVNKYEANTKKWISSADRMLSLYDELKEESVDGFLFIQRQFGSFLKAIDALEIPEGEKETFEINSYLSTNTESRYLREQFSSKITYLHAFRVFSIINQLHKNIEEILKDSISSGNEEVTKYFNPKSQSYKTFSNDVLSHLVSFIQRCQPTPEEKEQLLKDFDQKVDGIEDNIIKTNREKLSNL